MISLKYVKWLLDSLTKIKVFGLVGPMVERGQLSTFMVHLGIMGMMVSLSSYCHHLASTIQPPCGDVPRPLWELLKPLAGVIVNSVLEFCK